MFVIFLSGDHPEMGAFEFTQQLEAHADALLDVEWKIKIDLQNRLLFLVEKSDAHFGTPSQVIVERLIKLIVPKLALCHEAGKVLVDTNLEMSLEELESEHPDLSLKVTKNILKASEELLSQQNWDAMAKNGSTFAVKIQKIGDVAAKFFEKEITNQLAREIGGIIHDYFGKRKPVNLKSPEIMFQGILSSTRFVLYRVIARSARGTLRLRNPKNRPYSNPSILDPFLLRAMINISMTKPGAVILDPFCGTGSLFMEASDLGLLAIGIELSRYVSWGALQNIQGLLLPAHLILSDARLMPIATDSVDAIVFDPPYGRGASTLGSHINELLRSMLQQCERVLKKGRYLVMSLIHEVNFDDFYPPESHLVLIQTFEWYVHRSMTRKIYIFKNQK